MGKGRNSKMMSYEKLRLREAEITPTKEVLGKILGESYCAYESFVNGLKELEIANEWQYSNCACGKSWVARGEYKWTTMRGTHKSKNIYWLSAWDKYFVLAVWFKEDNRAEILNADVSEETKQRIRKGKMFGPKMRTFPVEFEITDIRLLVDIYTIIKYKIKLEAN